MSILVKPAPAALLAVVCALVSYYTVSLDLTVEQAWFACWLGGLALTASWGRRFPWTVLAIVPLPLLDWQKWPDCQERPQFIVAWSLGVLLASALGGLSNAPTRASAATALASNWRRLGAGSLACTVPLMLQRYAFPGQQAGPQGSAFRFDWLELERLLPIWLLLLVAAWLLAVRAYPTRPLLVATGLAALPVDRFLNYSLSALLPGWWCGYLALWMMLALQPRTRARLAGPVSAAACATAMAAVAVNIDSVTTLWQTCQAWLPLWICWWRLEKMGESAWTAAISGWLWINPLYWVLRLSAGFWRKLDGPGPDFQT